MQKIIPIAIILIIVALAIAAVVSLVRSFLGDSQPTTDTGRQALLNTSVTHSVRLTVRGPIVANENFRSYQINASSTSRSMTVYNGYLEQTLNSKQYDNNMKAYEEFVYALERANMVRGTEASGPAADIRGICASGRVYEYEVVEGSSTVKKLWTSSCKGAKGSLEANNDTLLTLFKAQIPDNQELLRGVKL